MDIPSSTKLCEQQISYLLQFYEAIIHEFLYAWRVYPIEAFEVRYLYNVPIHMCRHPQLCAYIYNMLYECREWIELNKFEKLIIVLLGSDNETPVDRLVIEMKSKGISENINEESSEQSDTSKGIAPVNHTSLQEQLRTLLIALVAAPTVLSIDDSKEYTSFRLIVHTLEDEQDVILSTNNGSWVAADKKWYDPSHVQIKDSTTSNNHNNMKIWDMIPIKSIESEEGPIKMQLYLQSCL